MIVYLGAMLIEGRSTTLLWRPSQALVAFMERVQAATRVASIRTRIRLVEGLSVKTTLVTMETRILSHR